MLLSAISLFGLFQIVAASFDTPVHIFPDWELNKRSQPSSFDTLGGMGLGKRSAFADFDELRIGKKAQISGLDTLAGMGLGKRGVMMEGPYGDKRALATFDSLGGMGFGKRSQNLLHKRAELNQLDSLGGMGLGKRAEELQ